MNTSAHKLEISFKLNTKKLQYKILKNKTYKFSVFILLYDNVFSY